MQNLSAATRAALSALATGILVFLLWDVLSGAVEPIETALTDRHWGRFWWLAILGVAGFAAGLMSLVYYSEWMKNRSLRRATPLVGPGAGAIDEVGGRRGLPTLTPRQKPAPLVAGRVRGAHLAR